jgi:TonB-dependent SusC/RagA subfamily outer membrane receptor
VGVLAHNSIADTSNNGLVIKDTYMPSNVPSPLIILNGKKYKGGWTNINPDSIATVEVLKNKAAVSIYGPKGANGVVIIQTKHYQVPTYQPKPLDSVEDKDALFVIDGVPSKNKLNDVDPKNILSIDILKKGKNSDSSFETVNDVVVVVTKSGATVTYQKKFSAFSDEYGEYMKNHDNNDSGVLYEVNGVPLLVLGYPQKQPDENIKKLFSISRNNLAKVIIKKEQPNEDGIRATVFITTKE